MCSAICRPKSKTGFDTFHQPTSWIFTKHTRLFQRRKYRSPIRSNIFRIYCIKLILISEQKMGSADDWSYPCLGDNEELEPTPEELDAMYQKLNAGETIELTWKCPGRRLPTPVQVADTEVKENANTEQASKNLEFDFMDEVAAPTMRVQRPISGPKSTAKKKTANFASVLDAMKKNKRTLQSAKEQ